MMEASTKSIIKTLPHPSLARGQISKFGSQYPTLLRYVILCAMCIML